MWCDGLKKKSGRHSWEHLKDYQTRKTWGKPSKKDQIGNLTNWKKRWQSERKFKLKLVINFICDQQSQTVIQQQRIIKYPRKKDTRSLDKVTLNENNNNPCWTAGDHLLVSTHQSDPARHRLPTHMKTTCRLSFSYLFVFFVWSISTAQAEGQLAGRERRLQNIPAAGSWP